MSGTQFIPPRYVPVNGSGKPYPLSKLYFYQAGTTTAANVYTTAALSVAHANPVVANSSGQFANIYLNPDAGYDFKCVHKTSADVTLWTEDNIPRGTQNYPITAAETSASVTPTDYGYPALNVRRYGALGDGSTTDNTAFTNAFLVAAVTDGEVYVPASSSYYKITAAIAIPTGTSIRGDGYGSIVKQTTASVANFTLTSVSNIRISGLHLKGGTDVTTTGRINLNAATNVTIDNCHFTSFSQMGVHSDGATDGITVRGCRFHDWASPINGSSAINVYTEGAQWTVVDNFIDGGSSSTSTGADFGISFLRSAGSGVFEQLVISGNQIRNVREYGIVVYANEENTTDVTISDNTIDYVYSSDDNTASGAGIYLLRPGNTTVTGNTIGHTNISTATSLLAPGGIGVNACYGNLLISGNTIRDTTMYGVYLVNGFSTGAIIVNGNGVYAPGYTGIYVFEQNNVSVIGNTVQTTDAAQSAIKALGLVGTHLENITISNNTILAAGDQQISATYCDDVVFNGNNIEMTDTSGNAVLFSACDRVVINGNAIKSDATTGVALYLSAVTAGRVSGNYLLCDHANAYYETTGTCTGTFADESNGLSLATNAGTGSHVVLRTTAAPAAGTHIAGDRAWDTDAASGAAPGWVCTTGGTPGTWKAMANLA